MVAIKEGDISILYNHMNLLGGFCSGISVTAPSQAIECKHRLLLLPLREEREESGVIDTKDDDRRGTTAGTDYSALMIDPASGVITATGHIAFILPNET